MDVASRARDVSALDRDLDELRSAADGVGSFVVYLVSASVFALGQPRVGRHRAAFVPVKDGEELTSHIPVIDKLAR